MGLRVRRSLNNGQTWHMVPVLTLNCMIYYDKKKKMIFEVYAVM